MKIIGYGKQDARTAARRRAGRGHNQVNSLLSLFCNFFYAFLRVSDGRSFPPPLPSAEESECFRLMREGDEKTRDAARTKLIEHNLRLVSHIVKKYYAGDAEQEDLLSIGTIGLIKAIDSFDPTNGARFATYAGKCLQNEILMYFRSKKKHLGEVSLDDEIDVDKDGNPLTYLDVIYLEDTIADDLHKKLCHARALNYIKNELTPRERQIVCLRCGVGGGEPMTQREIAARLGISRSYVSRIEKTAMQKLAKHLESPM